MEQMNRLPSLALDFGTPCRNDEGEVGRLYHLEFSHYHRIFCLSSGSHAPAWERKCSRSSGWSLLRRDQLAPLPKRLWKNSRLAVARVNSPSNSIRSV